MISITSLIIRCIVHWHVCIVWIVQQVIIFVRCIQIQTDEISSLIDHLLFQKDTIESRERERERSLLFECLFQTISYSSTVIYTYRLSKWSTSLIQRSLIFSMIIDVIVEWILLRNMTTAVTLGLSLPPSRKKTRYSKVENRMLPVRSFYYPIYF